MSFNSQKNRGTSVFRRKDAPIAPGNGFDHNKKRMNASNPPTAPGSFQDAPGINSGYNKKRNNWSDSSAAPGASSALDGSSPAPGRPYIASGNSTTAPGSFNRAPGTNFDYNKKRNNWSNGNQRNQVPYQNRNQNAGYNNKRNNGPNNGVRSGNIMDARNGNRSNQFRNKGPYRGNQYHNQHWDDQQANQGRQRLCSQDQDQDVDTDRPSNFNQGRNFNQGPRNFNQGNQEFNRGPQHFNRGGYNQRGGRQNVHFNNVPKKFQRTFRDIGIDTEMTDAPSDEPIDIEMVDAPPLITDPRIKAFAQGAQALQDIAHKMTILAGQLDPSVLLDYNCTA